MKILHLTDVHNATENLGTALEFGAREGYEVVAVTGDLLGGVLSPEQGRQLDKAFKFIDSNVKGLADAPFKGKLDYVLANGNEPDGPVKRVVQFYREMEELHDAGTRGQYQTIAKLFEGYPGRVLVVPGNWDRFEDFGKYGLFERWSLQSEQTEVDGVKFAGCGGAKTRHVEVPHTRFTEWDEAKAFRFLMETDADVVLSHVPPRGMCDLVVNPNGAKDNIGSWALRAYVAEARPNLFLCGHAHSPGYGRLPGYENSVIVNSGPLAAEQNVLKHGTALGVVLGEHNYVGSIIPYKVDRGKVDQFQETIVFDEQGNVVS